MGIWSLPFQDYGTTVGFHNDYDEKCPDASDSRPRLEWVVEIPDEEPFLEEPLLIAFDRTLRARNHDYDTKRIHDTGMLPPVLSVVPPGTFHAWLRSRGKLGGQNKVPRLMNDRSVIEVVVAVSGPRAVA